MDKKISLNHNPVIILLGPTGVGKTGLSILLAKALDTEIISADSMQIYRFMDIGTAKPSPEELKEVKHHLINILTPNESFSAGLFKKMAVDIINKLHSKNKVPLVAGGTGLYIRTLTGGFFEGPAADWPLREKLLKEEQQFGKGHLYKSLIKIDPVSAEKINPNDIRRIIRALEVLFKSKKPITEAHLLSTEHLDYRFIKVGLFRERKELYTLIEQRVDAMMERGLLQETEKLMQMNPGKIPLQALGYKEILPSIKGLMGINDAVRFLKKRSRMFAKRQLTWFKKEPDIQWVDITGLTDADRIFMKVINDVAILKELIYGKDEERKHRY